MFHALLRALNYSKSVSIMIMRRLLLLFFTLAVIPNIYGQKVSVKTNILYDATANVNLGVEGKLAKKWSLDVSGNFNDWTINEHKWKHWFIQPEARYWFCEAFLKHFVAVHAIGGEFNVGNIHNNIHFLGTDLSKLSDHRYQGWGIGGGIAYGYALPLNRQWNMEFEIGFGYVYLNYDVFQCQNCGRKIGSNHHNYVGPTKAALNLVYIF